MFGKKQSDDTSGSQPKEETKTEDVAVEKEQPTKDTQETTLEEVSQEDSQNHQEKEVKSMDDDLLLHEEDSDDKNAEEGEDSMTSLRLQMSLIHI